MPSTPQKSLTVFAFHNPKKPLTKRSVLRGTTFAALVVIANAANAIGLGPINVQSELNQKLQANIPLLGFNTEDIDNLNGTCIKARLETLDGAFMMMLQSALVRDSQPVITITSRQGIVEPAVTVKIEVSCTTRIQRNYQILLDPPLLLATVLDFQQPKSSAVISTDISAQTSSIKLSNNTKSTIAINTKETRKSRRSLLQKSIQEEKESTTTALSAERSLSKHNKKSQRNILRLSPNSSSFQESNTPLNLKTSLQLSTPDNPTDPKKLDELRQAQARLAVLLAGNDPSQDAENRIKTLQEKIQSLQLEVTRAREQSQADKMALQSAQEKLFSVNWLLGLGGLLLISLFVIGWLMRRKSTTQGTTQPPWWENKTSEAAVASSEPTFVNDASEPEIAATSVKVESKAPSAFQEDALNVSTTPAWSPSNFDVKQTRSLGQHTIDTMQLSGQTEGLKAEELSGGIEEAEFWMSLQLPQRAIEILEQHTQGIRPASPMPWLYLLDLYRETGDEKKYNTAVTQFEELFNVKGMAWNDIAFDNEDSKLEDFPHLIKEICDLWHTKSIIPFLENLLYDNRQGLRDGFNLPVYRDIMMLVSVAIELSHESNSSDVHQN